LSKKGAQAAAGGVVPHATPTHSPGRKLLRAWRVGGGVAAMEDVAYSLSDEGIEALAHYFAHL
jgi:hypothetical protein